MTDIKTLLNNQYDTRYKYLAVDGDGAVTLFVKRPHYELSANCKHTTREERLKHGMWIYAGTRGVKPLKEKVPPPVDPMEAIYEINGED